jgi:hypothetical protein
MDARIALLMVLLAVPFVSHAQTFKCRTPSGKMEFSDSPCAGGSRTERIQSNEYISPERQRQAREVQARNAAQVQGIEARDEAYRQQNQRQQVIQSQAEANNKANENIKSQQDECAQLATQKNMGRSQRAALAELCAKPEANKEKFDDCKAQLAKATSPSQRAFIASNCTGDPEAGARVREVSKQTPMPIPAAPEPLSIIKNCNGATCTDQTGQRYTTQAGKTVRSDGKRCYQQGNAMYCD